MRRKLCNKVGASAKAAFFRAKRSLSASFPLFLIQTLCRTLRDGCRKMRICSPLQLNRENAKWDELNNLLRFYRPPLPNRETTRVRSVLRVKMSRLDWTAERTASFIELIEKGSGKLLLVLCSFFIVLMQLTWFVRDMLGDRTFLRSRSCSGSIFLVFLLQ